MILQRMAQAIKRQDWFQVIIEIFIVVVGIFLGLQVSEWNDRRGDLKLEKFFLNQLHSEIVSGLELTEERIAYKDITYLNLIDLGEVLKGVKRREELSELYCYALYSANIFTDQPAALQTMNELLASDRLSLIQNDQIRSMLSEYSLALDTFNILTSDILINRTLMYQKFPELIKLDPTMYEIEISEAELLQFDNQCNLDDMFDNTPFINTLTDALGRNHYFVKHLRAIQTLMKKLHILIDQELSIIHEVASP